MAEGGEEMPTREMMKREQETISALIVMNLSKIEEKEKKLKDLTQALNKKAQKEKTGKLPDVREEKVNTRKKIFHEKYSTLQTKVEKIEQNLRDLAQTLYIRSQEALLRKPEDEHDEDKGKSEKYHYILISQIPSERSIVLALEFGHSYTSHALLCDASKDSCDLSSLLAKKTASAILLDDQDKFKFFGFEAEENYARIVDVKEEQQYHYFKSFPTVLRSCLKLGRSSSIRDEAGKPCDAQIVFALSIKYFVDMLLLKIESEHLNATMDDVNFVITIPAISGDTVSKFVIDAAIEAGIETDHVITVLEPVAASVYCQRTDSYHARNECFKPEEGETYLLVDLGGDSSKFTVHVKAGRDDLDRLESVIYCPWGGNSVNEEFFTILEDALGADVVDLLKANHAQSYLNFCRRFEIAKRKFTSETLKIEIAYPQQLDDIYREENNRSVNDAFTDSEYGKLMSVSGQNLEMKGKTFQQLFHPTLRAFKNYINDVLKKAENKDLRSILMVGGFSQCKLVQEDIVGHIKHEFPKHRVFIPKEPELAILKGAVFCGRLPYTLRGGIHQYTFGVQIWPKFNPEKHPEEKKVMVDGTARCKGGFSTFAQKGQRVEVGESYTKFFIVLEPDADILVCEIYASDKPNPQFTSECISQGTIEIKLPNIKPENLIMEESFHFGETEMYVTARDIYLKQYDVKCSYQMRIQE